MSRQGDASSSDRVWTLSDAIPGEPDRDYPILSDIPNTDFSCKGRKEGKIYEICCFCCIVCRPTSGLRFVRNVQQRQAMINWSVPFDRSFKAPQFSEQAIMRTSERAVKFFAFVPTRPMTQPRDLHSCVRTEPFSIKVNYSIKAKRFPSDTFPSFVFRLQNISCAIGT